jgi:hypothetical protein
MDICGSAPPYWYYSLDPTEPEPNKTREIINEEVIQISTACYAHNAAWILQ